MSARMRLVFVDDDPEEVEAFMSLTKGSMFDVIPICAQDATEAFAAVSDALGSNSPCLFVLDLYFPKSSDSLMGFRDLPAEKSAEVRRPVRQLSEAVGALERALADHPDNGKVLLREAHEATQAARRLLDTWCWHLDQSPRGGLDLLRKLHEGKRFADTPAVFYSRKATLRDAKDALDQGAIDVLAKLDRRASKDDERKLLKIFEAYCKNDKPSFLKNWINRVYPTLAISPAGVTAGLAIK